jgi:hypothetical protein
VKSIRSLGRMKVNGRRGTFLLLWALVYAILAWSSLMSGRIPSSLAWLGQYVPGEVLGTVWGVPVIFAIFGAFRPRPRDAFGFAALTAAPVLWSGLYLIGFFITKEVTSVVGIALYMGIAVMVMVVSGMEGATDRADRLNSTEGK